MRVCERPERLAEKMQTENSRPGFSRKALQLRETLAQERTCADKNL
jgi:hypothetical protein